MKENEQPYKQAKKKSLKARWVWERGEREIKKKRQTRQKKVKDKGCVERKREKENKQLNKLIKKIN